MRQGGWGNGSREKNLVGIITYQICYHYLPDLVLLLSRFGIIIYQIWYYHLPNLVLPLNDVDYACHFCDISVFQLKPLSQVGGSSGNPRDHSSHNRFCRLPSLHLHHHQNQGFVLQALQLHRILGISEYIFVIMKTSLPSPLRCEAWSRPTWGSSRTLWGTSMLSTSWLSQFSPLFNWW